MIILWMAFFAIAFAAENPECYNTALKLHNLQNRIVQKSFQELKPGTWARYNDGTLALYLGSQQLEGERLYGIEFQGTKIPVSQIWYAVIPKNFLILGKKVTFLTLDPRIAYLNMRGILVRVDKALIDFYLGRMPPISIGLTPAHIETSARCIHDTVVEPHSGIRLPGGKVINVSEIKDRTTGGVGYMSVEVPFGYVRTGPFGSPGKPVLVDYGYGGHAARITEAKRRAAKPAASFLFSPRGPR